MPQELEILERLRELEIEGRLSPDDVVSDARNPDSPLHGEFIWDDLLAAAAHAANAYRLEKARIIIRTIYAPARTQVR